MTPDAEVEAGLDDRGSASRRGSVDKWPAALEGVRVVDFSRIIAGPLAGQILADLGASVVKVEAPPMGDESRVYQSGSEVAPGAISPLFASFNRNKRSIVLDVKSSHGREAALKLIDRSDIVIENFRSGVMERLGLDYETVRVRNAAIIYCSISGFGAVGPLQHKAGNDLIAQAYGGILSYTGEPDRDPVRCPTSIGDLSAGMFAAIGILAALRHRERSGIGQYVQTSLLESMLALIGHQLSDYCETGILPVPMGSQNNLGQPNQVFRASDGWIAVSAANDKNWQAFCAGLGEPLLASDPRFATVPDRFLNRLELIEEVSRLVAGLTVSECCQRLEPTGCLFAPVLRLDQVVADPQVAALGSLVDTASGGKAFRVVKAPFNLSETPATIRAGAPLLGADTRSILQELGYAASEIDAITADESKGPQ
jgi:crotonobetainyl-CoA:carnitine CoA-transferase CaiB-like acyl-CoA transferase